MTKVVSIALFGAQGAKYAVYLPAFVRGHLNLFPPSEDWRLRVNIDRHVLASAAGRYLSRLFAEGLADVANMGEAPLTKAMLWRLGPVFDTDADFVFCRDLDAPPMPRDRACCDEFIRAAVEKKCVVHTIHDSPMHEGIMGGLCGFHAPVFREVTGWRSLEDLYEAAGDVDYAQHGVDQLVLNRLLLRHGGPRLFEHRYSGWHAGPDANRPRGPGWYQGAGVSAPIRNAVALDHDRVWNTTSVQHALSMMEKADYLGNHLGCAGYDHEAATRFWDAYGDPDVAAKVAACEAP